MKHNYIDIHGEPGKKFQLLLQRDNNLDKHDNLDELPEEPAIYAICGRVNGVPANPRYIGETGNLRKEIKDLFDKNLPAPENNELFKAFVLSIKLKTLVYELIADTPERRKILKEDWLTRYPPVCNEELNAIY